MSWSFQVDVKDTNIQNSVVSVLLWHDPWIQVTRIRSTVSGTQTRLNWEINVEVLVNLTLQRKVAVVLFYSGFWSGCQTEATLITLADDLHFNVDKLLSGLTSSIWYCGLHHLVEELGDKSRYQRDALWIGFSYLWTRFRLLWRPIVISMALVLWDSTRLSLIQFYISLSKSPGNAEILSHFLTAVIHWLRRHNGCNQTKD